jgi:hypothetical protein
MPRPSALLKRSLIFIHRWLGVALAVLFMMWFASGIVMMYWSFPGVSARDRREHAPALNAAATRITPEEAYSRLELDQPAAGVQLTSFDGRPVYRFEASFGGRRGRRGGGGAGSGTAATVYADDGTVQREVDDNMIDRAATSWAGGSLSDARKELVEEVDQWTVGGNLRSLRPLYKYSFTDGQQVYVAGRNAEVVQHTTRSSRFWAYLGAIPHWLYFTPLRKHQPQWFSFVVWSSGIGAIAALLGIVIAVWMYSPAKRYRYQNAPTSIPYRGWKRWHTIFGLVCGVTALTWAFSGLLSMGPFEFVDRITGNGGGAAENGKGKGREQRGRRPVNFAAVLRGPGPFQLSSFAAKPPSQALASLPASFRPTELEFTQFDGQPQYLATNASGDTRIIPVSGGGPVVEFDRARMLKIVQDAGGSSLAELKVIDQYDAYYLDRLREKPLPVIYARVNDESGSRYYVDLKTARLVGSYSSRNWVNRWLYHGLHSLDFPWLYNHRPLWDIVVISLMLGGAALCFTSLILAWRVVWRKLARLAEDRTSGNPPKPSDDLAPQAS